MSTSSRSTVSQCSIYHCVWYGPEKTPTGTDSKRPSSVLVRFGWGARIDAFSWSCEEEAVCRGEAFPQRSSLSPILYNLFMHAFAERVRAVPRKVTIQQKNAVVPPVLVLFVDDVLLTANSSTTLQKLLDICSKWPNITWNRKAGISEVLLSAETRHIFLLCLEALLERWRLKHAYVPPWVHSDWQAPRMLDAYVEQKMQYINSGFGTWYHCPEI